MDSKQKSDTSPYAWEQRHGGKKEEEPKRRNGFKRGLGLPTGG